jgi:transposase
LGAATRLLGAFYRRLSSRIGKQNAVTATARKIAVLFYNTLRFGMTYHDPEAAAYEVRHRTRVLANLQRRAKTFGFELAPVPAPGAVS